MVIHDRGGHSGGPRGSVTNPTDFSAVQWRIYGKKAQVENVQKGPFLGEDKEVVY